MTGFFKKLKNTAEKGLEKSTELGTKGFDAAKESAKKGYEKAREERKEKEGEIEPMQAEEIPPTENEPQNSSIETNPNQTPSPSSEEALKLLKLRYAKGEISKEEFEDMKKLVE